MAPASVVYSDDRVIAVLDAEPVNLGHVEIFPKIHVARLDDLDEETGAHMFRTAMRIAKALRRSGLRCEGINLLLADGRAASQHVFHVHLHVIPRVKGDGFETRVRPRFGLKRALRPDKRELDETAEKIRANLP